MVAPLLTVVAPAVVPRASSLARERIPALTVAVPVNVPAAVNDIRPAPSLVNPAEPATAPLISKSVAAVPLATVMLLLFTKKVLLMEDCIAELFTVKKLIGLKELPVPSTVAPVMVALFTASMNVCKSSTAPSFRVTSLVLSIRLLAKVRTVSVPTPSPMTRSPRIASTPALLASSSVPDSTVVVPVYVLALAPE